MATRAQMQTLARRHQELDAEITAEIKHPAFDEMRVFDLKRQKLRVKDRIAEIDLDVKPG
ncbi:MAG: YdcH family protein [Alphaproteobacteria bacterium]|nr:YdcH family protein [Alphaproteobacteria bacterium]